MVDSWIYCYHLDKLFYIPVTPDTLPNNYSPSFNLEEIMNRTAPKASFTGMKGRTLTVNLNIHSQLYFLDNPDKPNISKDLIKALVACSYPAYELEKSKIIPPSILMKFGKVSTIRGVIEGGVSCTWSGPWLKDGSMAMANVVFQVKETDQYSAEYISNWGTAPNIDFDLNR